MAEPVRRIPLAYDKAPKRVQNTALVHPQNKQKAENLSQASGSPGYHRRFFVVSPSGMRFVDPRKRLFIAFQTQRDLLKRQTLIIDQLILSTHDIATFLVWMLCPRMTEISGSASRNPVTNLKNSKGTFDALKRSF